MFLHPGWLAVFFTEAKSTVSIEMYLILCFHNDISIFHPVHERYFHLCVSFGHVFSEMRTLSEFELKSVVINERRFFSIEYLLGFEDVDDICWSRRLS